MPSDGGRVAIELEVTRQRAASWTVFGLVAGTLFIWKLGTVGEWAGVVLVVIGMFRAWELVQSFVHHPGTIVVSDSEVILPRGLHMNRPVKTKPSAITAVYFLRRSVPWNHASPVLVIELGKHAMAFPRDWFASEADQRHVVHALLRQREPATAVPEGSAAPSEAVVIGDGRSVWSELVGGLVLIGFGAVVSIVSFGSASAGGHYIVAIGPIVAGAMLLWRGINRRW